MVLGLSTPFLLMQGVIPTRPESSWLHFIQFEILTYGKAVPLLLTGLVLPLNFQELVIVQSIITAYNILFNPEICQTFYERLPENRAKYAQVMLPSNNPGFGALHSGTIFYSRSNTINTLVLEPYIAENPFHSPSNTSNILGF